MTDAFKASFVREVGASEENSWRNSLPKIKDLIEIADLKILILLLNMKFLITKVELIVYYLVKTSPTKITQS